MTFSLLVMKFLHLVAANTTKRSHGPASACCRYLEVVGWSLSCEGILSGPEWMPPIAILQCSRGELKRSLRTWWDVFLTSQLQDRRAAPVLPIDRNLCFRALKSVPDEDLCFLAMRLTNAFLSGTAKAKYVRCGDDFQTCNTLPTCSGSQCVFRHILAQHEVDFLFQFPFYSPDCITFFTDGVCSDPTLLVGRRAAWAVVQSKLSHEREILSEVTRPIGGGAFMDNFLCAGCGFAPGEQSAARGELSAFCAIFSSCRACQYEGDIHIFSDSKYVVDLVRKLSDDHSSASSVKRYMRNQDLTHILLDNWPSGRLCVEWIKAHREINDARSPRDAWLIAGNIAADTLAGAAVSCDSTSLQVVVNDLRLEHKAALHDISCVYKYFVELDQWKLDNIGGAQSEADKQSGDIAAPSSGGPRPSFQATRDKLAAWSVQSPQDTRICALDPNLALGIATGVQNAYAVWYWMQRVKWPTPRGEGIGPDAADCGICSLELLASFYLTTGARLPVVASHDRKKSVSTYIEYDSIEAQMLPASSHSAGKQAETLMLVVRQLNDMTGHCILPTQAVLDPKQTRIFGTLNSKGGSVKH